jgi:hypothetical protein
MASGIAGMKSGPFLPHHQAGKSSETNTAFNKSHGELTGLNPQNAASNGGTDNNYGMHRNELNSKQYQTQRILSAVPMGRSA